MQRSVQPDLVTVSHGLVLDLPVIERILRHIDEPTVPPEVLLARSPPRVELVFNQDLGVEDWPELDQTAGQADDSWE